MTAPVRAPAPSATRQGTSATGPAHQATAGADAPNPRIATDLPTSQPALRLVDTRRLLLARRRRRARVAMIAAGLLMVAMLFGVVFAHAMLVSGQGRLDQLERTVAEEQHRYQAMRLEVAALEAPSRIVAEAKGRLGMVDPPEITYLTPVRFDPDIPEGVDRAAADAATASAPWSTVKPLLGGRDG